MHASGAMAQATSKRAVNKLLSRWLIVGELHSGAKALHGPTWPFPEHCLANSCPFYAAGRAHYRTALVTTNTMPWPRLSRPPGYACASHRPPYLRSPEPMGMRRPELDLLLGLVAERMPIADSMCTRSCLRMAMAATHKAYAPALRHARMCRLLLQGALRQGEPTMQGHLPNRKIRLWIGMQKRLGAHARRTA